MKNVQITQYIKKQSPSHQKILEYLQQLIFKTFPGIKAEFKWGVPVYDGGRFYLGSLKKQVNLGFSIVGLSKEEVALFEGSGKTMRHIKIPSLKEIDKKQLVKLLKLVRKKTQCVEC